MVSGTSLVFIVLSFLISFFLPLGLVIYFYRRDRISLRAVLVGAVIIVVFTQFLERPAHIYLLGTNPQTASLLNNSPALFALYGGLMAGLFEEVGRFLGFRFLLGGLRAWKDGAAYGLGHGGTEAIMIGGLTNLNNFFYSLMINSGTFESSLGTALPASTLAFIKNALISTSPYMFLAGGLERAMALVIQIALSLLVLFAVKSGRYVFLLYAVLVHALLDFPAALYQAGRMNIWAVEVMLLVFAGAAWYSIIRSKGAFRSS